MIALHNSPIAAHGSLKSSKCLIDGRWVCKVSDHGLDSVKASQTEEDLGEYAKNRGKSIIYFLVRFLFHLFSLAQEITKDNKESMTRLLYSNALRRLVYVMY